MLGTVQYLFIVVCETLRHTNLARCAPGGVPCKKLFYLRQTAGRRVSPFEVLNGIGPLLQNALMPFCNRPGVEPIFETLRHLAGQVPFLAMGFRMGGDALDLVEAA